jgi:hypothetical protein
MKKWIALPTWLLLLIAQRIVMSEDHPWKHRRFTLQDWYDGSTPSSRQFDLVFWWMNFLFLVLLWRLAHG